MSLSSTGTARPRALHFFFGFVTINTASAKQELVTEWRRIALRYCRRWFVVELLSVGFPPFQAATDLHLTWVDTTSSYRHL